jgi:ankyrin repeat protein
MQAELRRDPAAHELVRYLREAPLLQPFGVWLAGERPLAYLVRTGLLQTAATLMLNPLVTLTVNEPGICSLTALHCAARAGDAHLTAALLRRGARPDVYTRDIADICEDGLVAPGGRTPLLFAAEAGHAEVVSLLLQARATNDADWHGDSPASLAARQGHAQVCALLQAAAHESPRSQQPRLQWDPPLLAADAVRARVQQCKRLTGRLELLEPFVAERALTAKECSELLDEVRAAGSRSGWQRQLDALYSTLDLPAHALKLDVYAKLRTALQARVVRAMEAHWRCAPLQMVECFFAWYQAPAAGAQPERDHQAGLALHRDSTLLNCVILLNSDFEGGGTVFADPEHGVQERTFTPPVGDALCSTGQVLHGAQPVRRGERFVLVAWFDEMVAFEGAQRAMRLIQPGATLSAKRDRACITAAKEARVSLKRQLASHSTRTHKRHHAAETPWADGADAAATPLRLVIRIINLRFRPEKLDSTIEMLQRLRVPTGVELDVEAVVADEGASATPYPHWKVASGTGVREPLMEEFWARDVLRGEVGAFVSHLKAIQDALPASRDYLLVLEDDAKFDPDFLSNVDQAINELRAAEMPWDAIDFGGVAVDEVEPVPVTPFLRRRGCTYLSHCILYSRSGVSKLRKVDRTINAVVFDEFLPAARGIHPRREINELWPLGLIVYHPPDVLSWQNATTHDTDASW